ncbi:MAG TPA: transporter associated domain-containing protein [Treponemataceae bacterium]|nr:transporter associated domain-containing protein [Treponemataceae bacterium]
MKRPKKEETDEEDIGVVIPANRKLGSCMTRRQDIVWIDSSLKKNAILEIINGHPEFGQFPICSGTVDSVLGVLPARAFLASLNEASWPGLRAIVKKPVYLPETASIRSALALLAKNDSRLAFIIDEYGGIEGIVSKNGLVNELLSGIAEGEANEESDIFRRDDGSWLIGGQVRLDEIREMIDISDEAKGKHDYYTLAGYLLAINGSIPRTGDKIDAGKYRFEIVDMDGHRIDKVLVTERTETV